MGLSRDWQTAQPRISAEGGPDSDDIAQYNDMEDFKFFCFGFGSAVFFFVFFDSSSKSLSRIYSNNSTKSM